MWKATGADGPAAAMWTHAAERLRLPLRLGRRAERCSASTSARYPRRRARLRDSLRVRPLGSRHAGERDLRRREPRRARGARRADDVVLGEVRVDGRSRSRSRAAICRRWSAWDGRPGAHKYMILDTRRRRRRAHGLGAGDDRRACSRRSTPIRDSDRSAIAASSTTSWPAGRAASPKPSTRAPAAKAAPPTRSSIPVVRRGRSSTLTGCGVQGHTWAQVCPLSHRPVNDEDRPLSHSGRMRWWCLGLRGILRSRRSFRRCTRWRDAGDSMCRSCWWVARTCHCGS